MYNKDPANYFVTKLQQRDKTTARTNFSIFPGLSGIIALVYLPSALFLFIPNRVAITREEIASLKLLFLKGTRDCSSYRVKCKSSAVRKQLYGNSYFNRYSFLFQSDRTTGRNMKRLNLNRVPEIEKCIGKVRSYVSTNFEK